MSHSYTITNPHSNTVAITSAKDGTQSASVTQNGSGRIVLGPQDAASVTLAARLADIEQVRQRAAWFQEKITKRGTKVDPITGELPYAYSEDERRRAMLNLQQLEATIRQQEAAAYEAAERARQVEQANLARMQAERDHRDAVDRRAREIVLEREAQAKARRLTIRGGEVS